MLSVTGCSGVARITFAMGQEVFLRLSSKKL